MIINGATLLQLAPIKNMLDHKVSEHGVSHGLSEAGYDIRIKQKILFSRSVWDRTQFVVEVQDNGQVTKLSDGRFTLASAMEEFDMPTNLVGYVKDKSSWARQGLSVFNTVIEPGWKGFLTLELVYYGERDLIIPAGAGIAQVLFEQTCEHAAYNGKYQHQADQPTPAKSST